MHKNLTARKIQSYETCPLQYQKITNREKGSGLPSVYLEIYSTFMRATDDFAKGHSLDVSFFKELLKESCSRKKIDLSSEVEENLEKMVTNLKKHPEYSNPMNGGSKFLKFLLKTKFGDAEMMSVPSRVDQSEESVMASFFKTGKPQQEKNLKSDINYYIAWRALKENNPGKRVQVMVCFFLDDSVIELDYSDFESKQLVGQIEFFLRESKSSSFGAKKSRGCYFCSYYLNCEAWPEKPCDKLGETLEQYLNRERLSYSRIGAYENCPYVYNKRYNLKEERAFTPQPFFSFGKAFHELMERLYEFHKPYRISYEQIIPIFERIWSKYPEGFKDHQESQEWFELGKKHLERYYKKYFENCEIIPAHLVEPYFELPLETPEGRKVILEGYIDRIDKTDDGYEVFDYKTEEKIRNQSEVDSDLQLAIYFAAGHKFLNLDIKRLTLLFTAAENPDDIPVTTSRTPEQIEEVLEHVAKQWDAICSESQWKPKENKYCNKCVYRSDCGLF